MKKLTSILLLFFLALFVALAILAAFVWLREPEPPLLNVRLTSAVHVPVAIPRAWLGMSYRLHDWRYSDVSSMDLCQDIVRKWVLTDAKNGEPEWRYSCEEQ